MRTKQLGLAMVLTVLAAASVVLHAQQGSQQQPPVKHAGPHGAAAAAKGAKMTMKGFLMDKMCSANALKNQDPQAAAMKHTKGCAMKEPCAKSGYGLVSDGKYYAFDGKGNELAAEFLKSTQKTNGLSLEVMGTHDQDGSIKVESLKEME